MEIVIFKHGCVVVFLSINAAKPQYSEQLNFINRSEMVGSFGFAKIKVNLIYFWLSLILQEDV